MGHWRLGRREGGASISCVYDKVQETGKVIVILERAWTMSTIRYSLETL